MIGLLVAVIGGVFVVFFGAVGVLVQLSSYWYVTGNDPCTAGLPGGG